MESLTANQKLTIQYQSERQKAKVLQDLDEKLSNPLTVQVKEPAIEKSTEELPQPKQKKERQQVPNIVMQGNLKVTRRTKSDPVYKVLKVNQKDYNFKKLMNEKLLRILERYELDKPILMQDKLDIIWDKPDEQDENEMSPQQNTKQEHKASDDPVNELLR